MRQRGWRFPAERRDVLKAADRNEWLPAEPILQTIGVGAGETAVDVGAGTGFWTEPLARLVGPTGRVIAVDVEPIMLNEIRTLTVQRGLTNVDLVQSGDASIPLDDGI